MKTAWGVSKIMEDRQVHMRTLEATRKVLLEKYCEKDEHGRFKTTDDKTQYMIEDVEQYNKEYEQLTDVEVEVTMLDRSLMDKLSSITPAQLLALKPFMH